MLIGYNQFIFKYTAQIVLNSARRSKRPTGFGDNDLVSSNIWKQQLLQLLAVLSCKRGLWVSFHCIDP